MDTDRITVSSTIKASPERVWEYWNRPEHITQWNFASPEWHCPSSENDLRVGGRFKSRMEARDGSMGFDFEGTYDEVQENRKIAYTMPDGRSVVTHFEEQDGNTRLSTTFDAERQNSVEMQRDGWQAIMENFKRYVEED